MVEAFINKKIMQITAYITAVVESSIHYTELDAFINDTFEEWTLLNVTEESPNNAKERVFWHVMHQLSLHGAQALLNNLFLKSEINTCLDFFNGKGSYPFDCVGWRPLP